MIERGDQAREVVVMGEQVRLEVRAFEALAQPWTREAWDVFEVMIARGGVAGRLALDAIAREAHPGWLELLLPLEEAARAARLAARWALVVRACAGEVLIASDAQVREALDRCDVARAAAVA